MKKIYFSMMALAIAAFTFTSCEDVPEPYNNPYDQIKPSEPEVVIEPAGSGTAEDPYNVAAIIEQTASLADGEFFNNSENVYVTGVVVETKERPRRFLHSMATPPIILLTTLRALTASMFTVASYSTVLLSLQRPTSR